MVIVGVDYVRDMSMVSENSDLYGVSCFKAKLLVAGLLISHVSQSWSLVVSFAGSW